MTLARLSSWSRQNGRGYHQYGWDCHPDPVKTGEDLINMISDCHPDGGRILWDVKHHRHFDSPMRREISSPIPQYLFLLKKQSVDAKFKIKRLRNWGRINKNNSFIWWKNSVVIKINNLFGFAHLCERRKKNLFGSTHLCERRKIFYLDPPTSVKCVKKIYLASPSDVKCVKKIISICPVMWNMQINYFLSANIAKVLNWIEL